jgi:hypothetical protein
VRLLIQKFLHWLGIADRPIENKDFEVDIVELEKDRKKLEGKE